MVLWLPKVFLYTLIGTSPPNRHQSAKSAPVRQIGTDPAGVAEIKSAQADLAEGRVISAEELRAKYLGT